MAEVTSRRTSPWIAFLAGAVVVLAVVLALFAWSHRGDAADGLKVTLRTADMPNLPHMPEGPKMPDPPILKPQ